MDVWCNGQKMETAVCDPFQRLFPGYGYVTKAYIISLYQRGQGSQDAPGLFQMTLTEFYNGLYFICLTSASLRINYAFLYPF